MNNNPTPSSQANSPSVESRREFIKQATAATAATALAASAVSAQAGPGRGKPVVAGGLVAEGEPAESWFPPESPPSVPNAARLSKVGRCPIVVGDMPYPNELIPHHLNTLASKYDFFNQPISQVPESELLKLEGDVALAYKKMQDIFRWILSETYKRLLGLNEGIVAANTGGGVEKYVQARSDYEQFVKSMAGYDAALEWIQVKPKFDTASDGTLGLISACSVALHWRNPYHSSSTIKIP